MTLRVVTTCADCETELVDDDESHICDLFVLAAKLGETTAPEFVEQLPKNGHAALDQLNAEARSLTEFVAGDLPFASVNREPVVAWVDVPAAGKLTEDQAKELMAPKPYRPAPPAIVSPSVFALAQGAEVPQPSPNDPLRVMATREDPHIDDRELSQKREAPTEPPAAPKLAEVKPLPVQPNADVVRLLEDLQARADRGEIRGIVVMFNEPGNQGNASAGDWDARDALYSFESWKNRMLAIQRGKEAP